MQICKACKRWYEYIFPFFSADMFRPVQQIKWEQSKVSNNCSVQSTIWRIGGHTCFPLFSLLKKTAWLWTANYLCYTRKRVARGFRLTHDQGQNVCEASNRKASVFRKFITSARRHSPPRQIHDWWVSSFFSWKPKDFLETLPKSGRIWSLVSLLVRDA